MARGDLGRGGDRLPIIPGIVWGMGVSKDRQCCAMIEGLPVGDPLRMETRITDLNFKSTAEF